MSSRGIKLPCLENKLFSSIDGIPFYFFQMSKLPILERLLSSQNVWPQDILPPLWTAKNTFFIFLMSLFKIFFKKIFGPFPGAPGTHAHHFRIPFSATYLLINPDVSTSFLSPSYSGTPDVSTSFHPSFFTVHYSVFNFIIYMYILYIYIYYI